MPVPNEYLRCGDCLSPIDPGEHRFAVLKLDRQTCTDVSGTAHRIAHQVIICTDCSCWYRDAIDLTEV
jgi:hypothetical protein